MTHHISFQPIESVALDDALLADLVVTAQVDGSATAPIGLVVQDVLTLGLSLGQARTLVTLLLEAQLAVARGSDLEHDHE